MSRSLPSDADMAWALIDAVRPDLDARQHQLACIEIGSGHEMRAIERILGEVVRSGLDLDRDVVGKIAHWLERYRMSGVETATFDYLLACLGNERGDPQGSAQPAAANGVASQRIHYLISETGVSRRVAVDLLDDIWTAFYCGSMNGPDSTRR